MTLLSIDDQSKLAALYDILVEARRGARKQTPVVELISVDWGGDDGRVYYAATQADDIWPELRTKLEGAPVQARFSAGQFLDLLRDSGTSDDSIALTFDDRDRAVSDLFETYGEGLRLEVFLYFPEVDLLRSEWFGHLRPGGDDGECDEEHFTAKAENGFMSVHLGLPRRAYFNTCQAVYGGLLKTQAEIDEYGMCPSNVHLTDEERGGAPLVGNLDPATGRPYPSCPRNTRAACILRIEPAGATTAPSFLADDNIATTYIVQAAHSSALATSRGNENNLKRPRRVVAGEWVLRDLDLLWYVVQIGNTAHPERGSITLRHSLCEGRIRSAAQPKANSTPIQPQHYAARLGWPRQPPFGQASENGYPLTAALQSVLQGDYRNVDPASIQMEVRMQGSDDVRVYTTETVFSEEYSRARSWWLMQLLRHKRYGLGADVRRFAIEADFIPLAAWDAERITWSDRSGNTYTGPRSNGFDADLVDRTAQDQINDLCAAGRYTPPFPYEGKLRVFPLKKLTAGELAAAQLFTDSDEFGEPNILREGERGEGKSTLMRTSVPDATIPNVLKATYFSAAHDFAEVPITIDDDTSVEQQLRAGRAFGDSGRRVIEKPYTLLGVTNEGEARRVGTLIRDLGEFDEGGILNNQRIRFQTFFTQAIGLYRSKVIRVLSRSLVNRRTGVQKFEYFRVRSIHRTSSLICEVSAQAYPVAYYEATEAPAPDDSSDDFTGGVTRTNPGGGRGARPRDVLVSSMTHTNDAIRFQLAPA